MFDVRTLTSFVFDVRTLSSFVLDVRTFPSFVSHVSIDLVFVYSLDCCDLIRQTTGDKLDKHCHDMKHWLIRLRHALICLIYYRVQQCTRDLAVCT